MFHLGGRCYLIRGYDQVSVGCFVKCFDEARALGKGIRVLGVHTLGLASRGNEQNSLALGWIDRKTSTRQRSACDGSSFFFKPWPLISDFEVSCV